MNQSFLRKTTLLAFDTVLINLSFLLAFVIRFDQTPEFSEVMALYQRLILPVTVIRLTTFYFSGMYEWSFRYASLSEAIRLLGAVSLGSLLMVVYIAFFFFHQFRTTIGRSVLVMDFLICLFFAEILRFSFRGLSKIGQEIRHYSRRSNLNRALILGVEDAGDLLAREFLERSEWGYWPIGFLDNDPKKWGARIHGIKIWGAFSELPRIAQQQNVRSVIIALSKISREEIQQIVKTCQQFHLECRIVPQTSYLWSSPTLPLELREVDISDLLGREIIRIDGKEMQEYFGDKKILITGAGGSIGSEFVKMLFQAHPRELLLVDNCEHNLYEIQQGFAEHLADTKVIGYLCDVTHRQELEKIFKRHRPDIVYHAAAYKHVPTLEYYYTQGIYNNILGTKIAADLALEYHVGCFVLISSDKAIRPTSMMGATKRVAELYTQSLGGGATRFISVRFGNVLNSKGSVVPLFKKQFEAGIALTVTDPEATRYFMDVSEAVCLILQATLLGSDSEIFVLDMGKPIKIIDLAQAIAQLMGISSDKVPIKFIGLRPGEKLKEEIQLESEQAIPTLHKKIKIWRTVNGSGSIGKAVEELLGLVNQGALREEVIQRLKQMIPEYQPWFPQETVCVGIKQEPPVSVENNAF